jgi:hypothetical protein
VVQAVALGDRARQRISAPLWSSSSSGVVPLARAASIASSTRSRETCPSSMMTSVRNRGPEFGERGAVMPFQDSRSPSSRSSITTASPAAAIVGGTGRR